MSFILIENGEVYGSEARGMQSMLLAGSQIIKMGAVDSRALASLDVEVETIDARGCIVIPGLIDPHIHLSGAGGEHGFGSRMPEVSFSQLVEAGITTAIGLIGTDVSGRSLSELLSKTRQLIEQGITAYMYTGGFAIPPATITGSVQNDIVLIDRIIGLGETAISDERSSSPTIEELIRFASQAMVGGMIAGKAGVTHFHTGSGKARLSLLHKLLDEHDLPPQALYAGHITRSHELMEDAIRLAARGAYVDMDTVEEDTAESLSYYLEHGGEPDQITVSSDSHTPGGTPEKFLGQFKACVQKLGLEQTLPCFTKNTAAVLKLKSKGQLCEKMDGDVLVLDKNTLDIQHVIAGGSLVYQEGKVIPQSETAEGV
jgi:beta-aspartyl-dipeptidase (metallo-type)